MTKYNHMFLLSQISLLPIRATVTVLSMGAAPGTLRTGFHFISVLLHIEYVLHYLHIFALLLRLSKYLYLRCNHVRRVAAALL